MPDSASSMSCDSFTRKLMVRIYTVYLLRQLGRPAVVESVFLASCVAVISTMVSMSNVFVNIERLPNDITILPIVHYLWSAFLNTDSLVKVLTMALAITGLLFCYSVILPAGKCIARRSGRYLGQAFYFIRGRFVHKLA
jgi:hypothetical protein